MIRKIHEWFGIRNYKRLWIEDRLQLESCKEEYCKVIQKLEDTRCDKEDCKERKIDIGCL